MAVLAHSFELGFTADLSAYGSDYKVHGGVDTTSQLNGGSEVSLEGALEWESGDLTHDVNISTSAEVTSEQDSSQWTVSPGIEYSLMGSTFIVDAGVEFNFASSKDMLLSYLLWLQKRLWKNGEYSLNSTGWIYYRDDGRVLGDVNLNFKKYVTKGLGGKIALGAKVDRDTLVTRVGPLAKTSLSYKFSNGISLDWNETVFYGFVTETRYAGGDVMGEFKVFGDVQLNWKRDWLTLYLTLRNIYRHYQDIPADYVGIIPQTTEYHSVKIGTKFTF